MNYERYAPFGTHAGNKVSVRTPVKPMGEAKEDWWIALQLGCLVDDPKNFFDGDPVKACDSILKKWGTTYADAQKNLPNMTQVQGAKQQPLKLCRTVSADSRISDQTDQRYSCSVHHALQDTQRFSVSSRN